LEFSWNCNPTKIFVLEGEFKDGIFHGQEVKTYTGQQHDKYREEGEFKDGDLFNGTIYDDKKGDIISKFVNGKRKNKPLFGW